VRALAQEKPGLEVLWRAFELRPEPAPTLDPQGEYLQRVWKNSVSPLAERLGMPMRLPPIQPRSRLAHEAAHWARSVSCFEAFHAAVFRALFERGEDIGTLETLIRLATALGLDGEELRRALEDHEFRRSVLEDEREAEAVGVRGVPAFVAGGRIVLSGVQPLGALKSVVE
jgi:predicted DsbA family dithiol-disulfide isomerase